ncbi:EAL domain-containing protein [Lysinibacillus irui]|uniref:EAL domain-containing protein n=1 Tax=Lysinibacillus irui TaxID=2998077 RepID=A0AAJ5S059_9BACI|nr:EAL domain-containing protein [Lysinibacillus irui]WDV09319.1 EAL domain-containing protein [Lysinibacillus irui]
MTLFSTNYVSNRDCAIESINGKTSFALIYVKLKDSKWNEGGQNTKDDLDFLERTVSSQRGSIEWYRVYEDEFVIILDIQEASKIIKEITLNDGMVVQSLLVENRQLPALHYLRQVSNRSENAVFKDGLDIKEFSTVFQPILHKNNQLSFEALMRWNSKDLGIITPNVFIPILDREGLLINLTKKIINDVVAILNKYKQIVYITINLTASLVKDITWLLEHLESINFNENRRIAFELTEESLASIEVRDNLKRIRERGHLLFIDDFGTGYSNFQYLATFNFDGVKLDRVFMGEQTNKKVIVLLSKFIKALDLKFIIEGVERFDQFSFLLETKYDAIQGYYISQPLKQIELDNFITRMNLGLLKKI